MPTAVQSKTRNPTKQLSAGQLCFGFFSIFCLLLILKNSEIAVTYIHRGLQLCAKTVVPSLFPFMVLSEIIVGGQTGTGLSARITYPLQRLFRLPSAGCSAVLLGLLCGFPVGAKCAILAFERGQLSKSEAERTLAFSNNPSSAFLIGAVGVSLWGNRRFGTALYVCTLVAGLLCGILLAHLEKKEPPIAQKRIHAPHQTAASPVTLFTGAVASATKSILLVCAYVIFFSALVGTLGILIGQCHLPPWLSASLFCIFELSGGVSQAAALGNRTHASLLTAFAVGWSGLSVHCQILSVCDGKSLSLRRYFWVKALQALLCPLLLGLLLYLFPALTLPAEICTKR